MPPPVGRWTGGEKGRTAEADQLDPHWQVCFFHMEDVVARSWRRVRRGMAHMIRFVIAVGVGLVVLLGDSALADDRCDQVKLAVAIYGYAAARKHALENYGKEAVAFGDKCLRGSGGHAPPETAEPKLGTGRVNPRPQSFPRP